MGVKPSCTTGGNQTQTITVNNSFSISNIAISQNCDSGGFKSITYTLSGGSGSYEANYNGGNWVPVYPDLIQWDPNWGSSNVNVTIRDLNNLSKQVSFTFSTNQCGQAGTFVINSPNARQRSDIEMQKDYDPISIYPNPSSGNFKLDFALEEKSNVNIFVLSMTGNIIAQKAVEARSGQNQIEFTIPNLKNGNYIIQVKSKTKTLTKLLNIHN